MKFIKPLNEKKPKGAPDFHHSDAPDAEGRFRDLGIKDLAAWLIKTRKKDVKKISGSLTQQVVLNRNDDPEYAEKMEKVRREVYKQLGRQDLLDKMDESVLERFNESSFRFGKKKQFSYDDINVAYGFWGTTEMNYDEEQTSIAWEDAFEMLTGYYKFSDDGALYYLNSKAGRHLADKFAGGEFYNMEDAMYDYAKDSQWKKWSKEYNKYAQEEMMSEAKQLPKEITKHKDIPSWAKYVAQHSDGEWTWYEETPTMVRFRSGGGAWKQDGNQTYTGVKTDGKDWDKIPTYYYVKNGKIIKESIDGLEDAKSRLENVYKHLGVEYGKTRKGDKYVQINYIPVSRPQSQNPEFYKVFYDNDKDLKKIGKELSMDLKESVINEEDSYNDYPAAAKKNAQMAIDWKEKYGRDEVPAGTPVGWARAHQLAKGEKISAETVKRMSAFNRHRKNSKIAPEHKDTPWKDNGYVAWLIWGGDEGVDWAMKKSKEIDAMEEVKEGKLSVKAFVGTEAGGPSYKKFGLRLKKLGSSIYGGDDVEISGPDSKLLQFAKASLGVGNKAKNVRDAQKEIDGMLESKGLKYIKPLNEGYWSHYDYEKWTKDNGKPKYPKWVKTTLKEIVKGGFMESHYDAEHNYMVLWLASLENKRRSELYAYDKKGKKEFGKVGYAMYQRFYNDLTGYNMFFMQGALYAMEVSKQIQDRIANGEPVEPAYYMMKEYFNNFGMDTKRSRTFNAAYEKLEKWMKDNQIETL